MQKGLVELVDLLLAKGASVDLKNNKDLGVIDLAAQAYVRATHRAHTCARRGHASLAPRAPLLGAPLGAPSARRLHLALAQ